MSQEQETLLLSLTNRGKAFYPGPWFDIKLYILFINIKEWIYVDRQPCYVE